VNIESRPDGGVRLSLEVKEGEKLARELRDISRKAAHRSSTALELRSLLRQAKYEAEDEFRQPPNIWTADAPSSPSVET
jgi:hypothetical protein